MRCFPNKVDSSLYYRHMTMNWVASTIARFTGPGPIPLPVDTESLMGPGEGERDDAPPPAPDLMENLSIHPTGNAKDDELDPPEYHSLSGGDDDDGDRDMEMELDTMRVRAIRLAPAVYLVDRLAYDMSTQPERIQYEEYPVADVGQEAEASSAGSDGGVPAVIDWNNWRVLTRADSHFMQVVAGVLERAHLATTADDGEAVEGGRDKVEALCGGCARFEEENAGAPSWLVLSPWAWAVYCSAGGETAAIRIPVDKAPAII